MLEQAIGNLLPSAVGVALSPVPIIAVILMLSTPKGRTNGSAFAVGWILGLVVVSVIVLLVAGGAGADDPDSSASTGVNWFQVVVGVLLVVLAVKQWGKRPGEGEEPQVPKWMEKIDSFGPGKCLGLGALLSGVNPKNLALTAAGMASIAQTGLSGSNSVVAVAVFVLIASVSVVGPAVFNLVAPEKTSAPLASLKILGQGFGALGG